MLGVTGLASHQGGSINTPSRFILRNPEISAGLMGLLARDFTLPFFFLLNNNKSKVTDANTNPVGVSVCHLAVIVVFY